MKRKLQITLISLFLFVLYGFPILFVVLPDQSFSAEENRNLQTFPAFSVESLLDGSFSSKINTYFADQFPLRNGLVGIKGVAETVLWKGENNGVLLGSDGQLGVRLFTMYKSRLERTADMDFYYAENVQSAIDGVNAFAESCSLPLVTLLPPRTVDVAADSFSYPTLLSDRLHEQLVSGFSSDAHFLDVLPLVRDKHTAGEYVYLRTASAIYTPKNGIDYVGDQKECFDGVAEKLNAGIQSVNVVDVMKKHAEEDIYLRTDHHWTTYGAYLAYCEVMREFGMEAEILPESAFTKETIEDFYGTTWSKAGYKFVGPDTIELWSLGNDDDFTLTFYSAKQAKDENGKIITVREPYQTMTSFYNRDKLSEKDKYAAFLDGTHNELTVSKTNGNFGDREVLLIAKDSFANTMVPFLSQHFDIVIVNLAANLTDLSSYIDLYGADRVLLVYNWQNILENNNLAAIH